MNALKTKCFLRAHLPTLVLAFLPSWAAADCAYNSAYLGHVCMTGYNFCPINTLPADGRQISIAGNDALFSLLGTTYGGDGVTTFALPNLSSRSPVGSGTGTGLAAVAQVQIWGAEERSLTTNTMPSHNHAASSTLQANTTAGTEAAPSNGKNALAGVAVQELTGNGVVAAQRWAAPEGDSEKTTTVAGLSATLIPAGSNLPFDTAPPSLGVRYCVVTAGIYPTQN